ncbi:Cir_N domain-containing protein [Lamellibrachia satsuma]|nr:Cir_N domain-containing protein [Lamellibrachia satsuma]
MNILPKKSWHVRTKANIERVRKDEAQAAEEEKERQRKIALAESEARTDLLRERSRKRKRTESVTDISSTDVTSSDVSSVSVISESKHINFFQDLEDGKKGEGTNAEYEQEKKEEKEKQERAIGLLTYLGQSAVEAQAEKPWYFKPPEKWQKNKEAVSTSTLEKKKDEFQAKKKRKMDPLCGMMGYLDQTRKVNERRSGTEGKERSRHSHKHKHKKISDVTPSKTREQMRAERLRREQEERIKTEKLLAKLRGEKVPSETQEAVFDERQMGYNSQFNPMFARKRKSR